jgi:hypothetical protein
MSETFTTDSISGLQARLLDGGAWEILFRSENTGLCHQLYAEGRLVSATDSPPRRRFILGGICGGARLRVAAVDAKNRWTDYSSQLPPLPPAGSGGMFSVAVVRGIEHARGDVVALMGDHAADGGLWPLATREIWPAGAPRWGWGEDRFGLGGAGYDGSVAPGLGRGAFGAGQFGMNAETFILTADLPEAGTHRLLLRTLKPDGRYCDSAEETIISDPPAVSGVLMPIGYDADTQTLTVELKKG